ncbi:MAG: hydroxyisourate hydrolase [Kyrpidia sp.]|nr:hydroxyisourate hydrolase [Kyrpidia sp.]
MGGQLTTHVLDLTVGRPAPGVRVELWRADESERKERIRTAVTNGDGRLDEPLLAGEEMRTGWYEVRFFPGAYYRSGGRPRPKAVFFDRIPVVVRIEDPDAHYHVPLLISPGGYSVYRGS